jgi:hypothetical protein
MGWSLQGRTFVLGDAGRPTRDADGTDPTYTFLERNAGHFGELSEPSLTDELGNSLKQPWRGFELWSVAGLVLGVVVLGGVVIAVTARRAPPRVALVTSVVFSALLVTGVLYFALSYDTYVPRHTGLARFTQYMPLLVVLLIGIALTGVRDRFVARQRGVPGAAGRIAVAAVAVCAATAFGIWATVDLYQDDTRLGPAGAATYRYLRDHGRDGEVVLSNAGTRGQFEFFTGLEDPLEARQALLETPAFARRATGLLESAHRFFTGAGDADLADRLHASWVVVTPAGSFLGAGTSYGQPPPGWAPPGFREVFRRDGVVVFEREGKHPHVRAVGPHRDRAGETVVVLLGGAALAAGAWALRRRAVSARRTTGSPVPPPPSADRDGAQAR